MYTAYFGLRLPPFGITPDTRRFFGGGDRAEILHTLRYAVVSGEGVIKVTGEVGTGKTMLCRMLQESLPKHFVTICLANPRLEPEELVGTLLLELGLTVTPDVDRTGQLRMLREYLAEQYSSSRRLAVIVEEAQKLSATTLETLRLLSNQEDSQGKRMQLILLGRPELDTLLANPDLHPLRDRITYEFRLEALDVQGVADYIRFRLYRSGYQGGDLFTSAAYRKLWRASHGLIRRIHVLADRAMQAAYTDQCQLVEKRHVLRALRNDADHVTTPVRRPWSLAAIAAGVAVVVVSGAHLWKSQLPVMPLWGDGQTSLAAVESESQPGAATQNDEAMQPGFSPATDERRIAELPSEQLAALTSIRPSAGRNYVAQRLSATDAWLSKEAQGRLTIQVLLTEDDDRRRLEALFRRDDIQPLIDNLYLHETEVAGRKRFSVLYGEFENRTAAYRALAELPDVLQMYKPFLRSLDVIRAAENPESAQG